MKSLTLSAAVMALLVLPASSTFAASNDRHRARAHDGASAGAYRYEGTRPLYAGGAWSTGPIYRHGYYLGTDPDSPVRAEIGRDKFSGRGPGRRSGSGKIRSPGFLAAGGLAD